MTSKTPQLRAKAPPIPSPTEGAPLRELIQILIDVGVRANGPLKPWTWEEFAATASITSRQLRKLRESDDCLPQTAKFRGFLLAFFGKDPTNHPEWRNALANARERVRIARKKSTVSKDQRARPRPVTDEVGSHVRRPQAVHRGRMPLHFHGRQRELETIDALLTSEPHRVALHGPHGIGKTALAAAYAFHYRHTYRAVAWIDAETEVGCSGAIIAFGQRMGWCAASSTNEAALAETLLHLAEEGTGCLIVYDNAPSPAALHPYLPNGSPHVLITSNFPTWRSEAVPTELIGWSPDVGGAYLSKRLSITDNSRDACELSNELGGFPLALELAATFCERRQLSVGDYRQRLSQSSGRYLLKTGLNIPGYPRSVYDVFALAMTAAEVEHPAAISLLRFLCALGPEPIPRFAITARSLLTHDRTVSPMDNDTCDAALAALRSYALITATPIPFAHGEPFVNAVTVHRLVSLVVEECFGSSEADTYIAAGTIAACFPESIEDASAQNEQLYLLKPHVTHLLGKTDVDLAIPTIALLHGRYSIYRTAGNRPREAVHHAYRYYASLKRAHSSESQEISDGLLALGLAFNGCGKYCSAEIVLERAHCIRSHAHADWHPAVVETMRALSSTACNRGNLERNEQILESILSSRHLTWPQDHPDLARVLFALAAVRLTQKRYSDALFALAEAFVMQILLLLPDHRETAQTRRRLAQLHSETAGNGNSLSSIEEQCHLAMESRSRNPIDQARLSLELGLACLSIGHREVGLAYVHKALSVFPDPSPERLRAITKLSRFRTVLDPLFPDSRAALEQAIKLKDQVAIHRWATILHKSLHRFGSKEEAAEIYNRYLENRSW